MKKVNLRRTLSSVAIGLGVFGVFDATFNPPAYVPIPQTVQRVNEVANLIRDARPAPSRYNAAENSYNSLGEEWYALLEAGALSDKQAYQTALDARHKPDRLGFAELGLSTILFGLGFATSPGFKKFVDKIS